ncbi:MAG TPA: saccharopine dehydrogenase NADP-binding domain-containing protein [Thermoanaerobaculia bacterium]|nr:saccharopine dehydrogenase NADP-binding domain-containing protein [Thermoanaerobaculia bacterium]
MSGDAWMIYGANGYTGELVARRAVEAGMKPVLAGRREEAVAALAAELGLPHRAFPLSDPNSVAASLADVDAVVHCAGPFVDTAKPMIAGCIASGTHYLDITGEMVVFEGVMSRHELARHAGVVLLPGVGFDVVPTDSMAARLAAALPGASHLDLAFVSDGGGLSRGTTRTMIRNLPHLGAIREDGRIRPVPAAYDSMKLDLTLPDGTSFSRWAMTVPWGDVSTAYHTTGIPNIRVYTGTPPKAIRRLRRLRWLIPLTGFAPIKRFLMSRAEKKFADKKGPSAAARKSGRMVVWGRVRHPDGRSAESVLVTPEGYRFTALAAVECARRVLAGEAEPGSHTPAGAFGPELVESIDGVEVGEVKLSMAEEG